MRDFYYSATFDFEADQAFGLAEGWIGVDQDCHDVTVDDVDERVSIGDDLVLIPVADLDVRLEFV